MIHNHSYHKWIPAIKQWTLIPFSSIIFRFKAPLNPFPRSFLLSGWLNFKLFSQKEPDFEVILVRVRWARTQGKKFKPLCGRGY